MMQRAIRTLAGRLAGSGGHALANFTGFQAGRSLAGSAASAASTPVVITTAYRSFFTITVAHFDSKVVDGAPDETQTVMPSAQPNSKTATTAEAPTADHTASASGGEVSQPSTPAEGSADAESALDVAMRVNKMKRMHQTGSPGMNKKDVESEAWSALNSLSENQINTAEGKAVSLLLNSWAYFAKYWEKGKDGPASTGSA